jgi:hypothetical protein
MRRPGCWRTVGPSKGGDAGSRTRVRNKRTHTSTSLAVSSSFAERSGSSHRPVAQLANGLMPVYRRPRTASCGSDDALHRRRNPAEAPWSPCGDQLVPYPCLRSQRKSVVASEGEGERFASVGSCVFAPDLRGESTSACSVRPICPVETSHPPCASRIPQKAWYGQIWSSLQRYSRSKSFSTRLRSRSMSRSATACRLSYTRFPRANATSTLARPSLR